MSGLGDCKYAFGQCFPDGPCDDCDDRCRGCDGWGRVGSVNPEPCHDCGGSGTRSVPSEDSNQNKEADG